MSYRGGFTRPALTDEQYDLLAAFDDVVEHCHFEIDADDYRGLSTCGFASIVGIDGRSSLVRRAKALADRGNPHFSRKERDVFDIRMAGFRFLLHPHYEGGYRLSVIGQNVLDGPDVQRLDFQERIHGEVLSRLNENGYIPDARVTSRMD